MLHNVFHVYSLIVQSSVWKCRVQCRVLCESAELYVKVCCSVCSAVDSKGVPSGQAAAPVSLFLISLHLSHSLQYSSILNKCTLMQKCGVGWGETISRFHVPAIKASDAVENLLPVQSGRYHFRAPQLKKSQNALHPLAFLAKPQQLQNRTVETMKWKFWLDSDWWITFFGK